MCRAAFHTVEQVETKHAEKMQAEENDDETGRDIDGGRIRAQQSAKRTGERAVQFKDKCESGDKAKCVLQCFSQAAVAARKVGNVNG